ncbi:alpha/beta fold hydrolase [Vagococcus elongatus]|uniref:Peptidase S9 prolyl oligopeptidase catalytic domain-containing protein n=1 Tax=Vagococcus elongatus TaxID=180344 RepID=A0A430B204_9ENTE|nr:alpha/beta fold hydrolase [Vagococcus elongatus]RSU14338.1 hypothetical protein CBF29_03290 [Vagococcus elongatus]
MKLTIHKRMIKEIPVLEVVPENKSSAPLPLIIFYHGWQNTKELSLTQARRLAANNFRVIIPDAMFHGKRNQWDRSSIPSLTFWTTIAYNLLEFSIILDYAHKKNWILDHRIGVSGYSMGGITTSALLTSHPEISAAASIMGTSQPWAYFNLMKSRIKDTNYLLPDELTLILQWVKDVDLGRHPEKIDGRPFLLWHGTLDDRIPYTLTKKFYDNIKEQSYAERTIFLTGKEEGHLVTTELMDTITDFFTANL